MAGEIPVTRRTAVEAMAGGVAAALVVSPATAAAPAQKSGATQIKDPVTAYPKPPFPKQQQEWPGLASKMNPPPDHGESSYKGSGRLMGRRALITGGDSGMGRAAAIAYAREGANVAINYLPAEESDAQDVAKLIRAAGRKAVLLPGDLRNEEFCNHLVAEAVRQLGGLDIVVNNAARQVARDSILDISAAQLDDTFKTNIYAPFLITKAALPHLPPGSCIINTASVVAYEPPENILDYAATKGALVAFTKGLAKQLAEKGIRVNAVAPGPIWTPLQVTGGQKPEAIPTFGQDTPMKRAGQPAELAALYVILATPEASYSSGQVFGAVGGRGGP